jgi:AcrR family transcriptional regulator
MGRWEPNARGRLEKAALELYDERGFDATTVAEIAARAGLTERTFFRHFADKREVLFGGSEALREHLARGTLDAPASLGPVEAIVHSMTEMAEDVFVGERRALARHRAAIIAAHPDLRERELIKMASFSAALAQAVRQRGVAEPFAALAAEAGIAIFKVSFERWLGAAEPDSATVPAAEPRPLAEFIREALKDLKTITS